MKVVISLSGLHRVQRGAEVALEAIGRDLGERGHQITLIGSGAPRDGEPYQYRRVPVIKREHFERWPRFGPLRDPATYESLSFAPGLACRAPLKHCDVTLTCGFPVDNLVLRRPLIRGHRPPHVFVTENGDWPAQLDAGEARWFSCDALVCTNPLFYERNAERWNAFLVPNGVDVDRFSPGPRRREQLGIPAGAPVVLMVSALADNKRVAEGIRAVARIPDVVLVVAGDGPLRGELQALGGELLGDRYVQRSIAHAMMPDLYRSADVLLHMARFESFGNIYIEAMATGLPIVTHGSVVTDWILGPLGALVDTDDPAQVVEALEAVLRVGRDAGAAERRDAAVERFSWRAVGAQYEHILTGIR